MILTDAIDDSQGAPPVARYQLHPMAIALLIASVIFGVGAFFVAAYILFPYIAGPYDDGLWWKFNAALIVLAGVTGLAAILLVRRDQHAAGVAAAARLKRWRVLAFACTGGYLGAYLLLCAVLTPGAPLWFAQGADVVAALLALLALAACYYAPIGHWWELFYSMGTLLTLVGAMAFWFPAIDGFYGAFLFAFILYKWSRSVIALGRGERPQSLAWGAYLVGWSRVVASRAARQHEILHTIMLALAVLPLAMFLGMRPWFQPWDEQALEMFSYVMLAGTLCLYTAPLLCSAALLFWCRHYQALDAEARAHFVVRRQHLALALLGVASYVAAAGYYFGQVVRGPLAYTVFALVIAAVLLSLASRRRLLLLLPVLPIAVAVSLKKLNYIGDFLMPLYVGIPIGK